MQYMRDKDNRSKNFVRGGDDNVSISESALKSPVPKKTQVKHLNLKDIDSNEESHSVRDIGHRQRKINPRKTLQNYQKGNEIKCLVTNEPVEAKKIERLDSLDVNSVMDLPHNRSNNSLEQNYGRANSDCGDPNTMDHQIMNPFDLAIDPVKHGQKSILKKKNGKDTQINPTSYRGADAYDRNKNSVPLPLKTIEDDEPSEDSEFGRSRRL